MTIRLYFDEDSMRTSMVDALRARGIYVLTAHEANRIEKPDEEHLEFEASEGLVLNTSNIGDFYQLHTEFVSQGKSHAGIIGSPQQRHLVGEELRRLLKIIASRSADEMLNQFEFLSNWS